MGLYMTEEKRARKVKQDVSLSNNEILQKIAVLSDQINELRKQMKPIELPKQATLHECNVLARQNKTKAK